MESNDERKEPRVLIMVRNHIQVECMEVKVQDVVAIRVDGLLIFNVYNQKQEKKPKN